MYFATHNHLALCNPVDYTVLDSLGQNTGVGSLFPDNQALRPAVKPVIAFSVLSPAYTKPGSQSPLPR